MFNSKKLYYVAVCKKKKSRNSTNSDEGWQIKHSFRHEDNFESDLGSNKGKYVFELYASQKMNLFPKGNFFSYNETASLGKWYFKGYKKCIYIVVTSFQYDDIVAIECLDELCETYRKASLTWNSDKRIENQTACCTLIGLRYSSFDDGTAPKVLVSGIDESIRIPYSNSVRRLFDHVDAVKLKLQESMIEQLQNIDSAEELERKSFEVMEHVKIFKKNAKELKSKTMYTHMKVLAAVATIGGFVGFLAGGPGGAVLLTGMGSVAAAQLVEAGLGAALFTVSFIGAESAIENWTTSQRFVPL